MFKASGLVSFAKSMLGMPYWYGTCVYKCTESLLTRKTAQYPAHYTSDRMSKYRDAISKKKVSCDCVGLIKGYFWTDGGNGVAEYIKGNGDFKNTYGANGCPDKSANGMRDWCRSQGAKNGVIADIPDVPGVLVFMDGHVGVYVGDGYVIEARGFAHGVVQTRLRERPWRHWAYLPSSILEYDTDGSAPAGNTGSAATTQRVIKRGVKGDDVKKVQEQLMKLGYKLPRYGADGDCGSETVSAIMAFQRDNGLTQDGEFGAKCYAKMAELMSGASVVDNQQPATFHVRVTGGRVNVRNAPNTQTGRVAYIAKKGDVLVATGTAPNGWFALDDGNYISNKYTVRA